MLVAVNNNRFQKAMQITPQHTKKKFHFLRPYTHGRIVDSRGRTNHNFLRNFTADFLSGHINLHPQQ